MVVAVTGHATRSVSGMFPPAARPMLREGDSGQVPNAVVRFALALTARHPRRPPCVRPDSASSVLVLLAAVLLGAAGLGGAGTAPAAQAGPSKAATHWCNFVLAGKNATADGSVLMGYNNDWSANNYVYLQAVPGDATHNKYVKLYTWGGVPEGGINEHQLGALYGTATDLDKSVLAADPYVKKGYGGEIWDLILQQCSTAQEAIDLLEQMAQTGFSAGAAGSFAVGDPDEAWLFELLGGHHWVAQRVPDNAFLAHPNMVTVRQVDLADTANFRGSSDLQSFAQSIGRYSPQDGPFDVAWAYGDRGGPAELLQHQPAVGRLRHGGSVARPHPDDALRDASGLLWSPTRQSHASRSSPSAATTTRARASTRRRTTR